jgi:hypothetical protein
VNGWRTVICAILVYVALDFLLPSMPGAFVFDPSESVESVHAKRDASIVVAVRTALLPNRFARTDRGAEVVRRMPAPRARAPISHVRAHTLWRAALDPSATAEDPH